MTSLAAGYPTPEGGFSIAPSLPELLATGRVIFGGATRRGRRREAEQWHALGLQPPRNHILQAFSAATDELFLNAVRAMTSKTASLEIGRVIAETYSALDIYRRDGRLASPAAFHVTPPPMDPQISSITFAGAPWKRLVGREAWIPPADSPGSARWLAYPGGQKPVVHVLRHPEPRPWLVMVHGAYMGELRIDTRIFDVQTLHHKLGLNIAMPTLPLHGERKATSGLSRSLPSLDTMDNLHGLTQAVYEIRSLLAWIRQQEPGAKIGLYGVSLGSYVSALAAGLEEPLDLLLAGIPAVDFNAVFLGQTPASVRKTQWFHAFHEAVVELNQQLLPLTATPATPLNRRYIYAARGDRVLPAQEQSLKLWEHWGRPRTFWFDGAHVPQVRNKRVRQFVAEAAAAQLS